MTSFLTLLYPSCFPAFFNEAGSIAEAILKSDLYADVVCNLFPDIERGRVVEFVAAGNFEVGVIQLSNDLDAYTLIYPDLPRRIFFNPLLLMNLKITEEDSRGHIRKKPKPDPSQPQQSDPLKRMTVFLVVKIVREISRLVNLSCNSVVAVSKRTPPKRVEPGDKVLTRDFGDMIERKIFGGILEHTHSRQTNKIAYELEMLVMYSVPKLDFGQIVTWSPSFFDIPRVSNLAEAVRLIPIGEIQQPSTGSRNHLRISSKASVGFEYQSDDEVESSERIRSKA